MDAASIKPSGSPHASRGEEHEDNGGSQPKRRKVRKGTRSCWECRRRKLKCIFGSPADTACISCKRRGAKCVDQQFPEHISTPLDRSLQMGDRVVRVEALVEQLLNKVSNSSDPCCTCTTAQDNGNSRHDIISPDTNSPLLSPSHSSYEHLTVRVQRSKGVSEGLLTYFLSTTRLLNTKSWTAMATADLVIEYLIKIVLLNEKNTLHYPEFYMNPYLRHRTSR